MSIFRGLKYIFLSVTILCHWCTYLLAERPNVLILNIDDLKPLLGCYGSNIVQSPNMDALAKHGTTMMANYCQQAVCAASRVSFYTGMRPDNTGVRDLNTFMRDINPNILTMPEVFKQNGYDSIGFGKILHGAKQDDPQSWTLRQDEELPYLDEGMAPIAGKYQNEEIRKIYEGMLAKQKTIKSNAMMSKLKKSNMYPATECLDLPDDAYSDGAIAKIGQSTLEHYAETQKPFFLVLGFRKPHLPFVAPKKYWDLYSRKDLKIHPYQEQKNDRPAYAYHTYGELGAYTGYTAGEKVPEDQQLELIHGYLACVSYVDAQVGKIMATLKQTGLDKNTIVVLWGDHGWHLGDHGLWCKHSNFEQATRAPLIIAGPHLLKDKKIYSETEFIDVFSTLCDLAQLPKPDQLDGVSLVPLLKGEVERVKDGAMSQYTRHKATGYALRSGAYRLVYWMKNDFISFMKYSDQYLDAVELYDYDKDPYETTNLANDPQYADLQKALRKKMLNYFNHVHNEEKGMSQLAKINQYSRKKSNEE